MGALWPFNLILCYFQVAVALEKAALSDDYFVKRKLYPNVDFYSGLIYRWADIFFGKNVKFLYWADKLIIRAMGFPAEFFTVLFAIPRMAGYLAHWRESLDDPDTKIMRPAQVRFVALLLPLFTSLLEQICWTFWSTWKSLGFWESTWRWRSLKVRNFLLLISALIPFF